MIYCFHGVSVTWVWACLKALSVVGCWGQWPPQQEFERCFVLHSEEHRNEALEKKHSKFTSLRAVSQFGMVTWGVIRYRAAPTLMGGRAVIYKGGVINELTLMKNRIGKAKYYPAYIYYTPYLDRRGMPEHTTIMNLLNLVKGKLVACMESCLSNQVFL